MAPSTAPSGRERPNSFGPFRPSGAALTSGCSDSGIEQNASQDGERRRDESNRLVCSPAETLWIERLQSVDARSDEGCAVIWNRLQLNPSAFLAS
jgi:hypothetical protein